MLCVGRREIGGASLLKLGTTRSYWMPGIPRSHVLFAQPQMCGATSRDCRLPSQAPRHLAKPIKAPICLPPSAEAGPQSPTSWQSLLPLDMDEWSRHIAISRFRSVQSRRSVGASAKEWSSDKILAAESYVSQYRSLFHGFRKRSHTPAFDIRRNCHCAFLMCIAQPGLLQYARRDHSVSIITYAGEWEKTHYTNVLCSTNYDMSNNLSNRTRAVKVALNEQGPARWPDSFLIRAQPLH